MSKHYKIEKLPGEPIGIFTTFENYDISADAPAAVQDGISFLDEQDEQIFFILDFLAVSAPDLEDVSVGAMASAMSENPVFKHSNIRELIVVTATMILVLSFQGMDSPIYGNIKSKIFATLDEALEYARSAA